MPRIAVRAAWLRAGPAAHGPGAVVRWLLPGMGLALAIALALASAQPAFADPIKGEASLTKPGNYARLVVKLASQDDAEVRLAGTVLIIRFKNPVDVNVDKLGDAVPDYIGSARLDPDGAAIRLALTRAVTPNVMSAGERLFVDLLPDSWTGMPPALPSEVIKELADRARLAEQKLKEQKLVAQAKKQPPVRVKASRQPTFIRYVFELPDGVGVSSILNSGELTLNFNARLTFDLADAHVVDSANVSSIEQRMNGDNSTVAFGVVGDVDVHSFRDEGNYIVDIGFDPDVKSKLDQLKSAAASAIKPSAQATAADEPQKKASASAPAAPPAPSAGATAQPATAAATPTPPPASPQPETPSAPPATNPERATPSAQAEKAEGKAAEAPPPAMKPVAAPSADKPAQAQIQPPPATAATPAAATAVDEGRVTVQAKFSGGTLRLYVPFPTPRAGAVFNRGDAIWLVFGGSAPIDPGQIVNESSGLVVEAASVAVRDGRAIRLRVSRPQLPTLSADGNAWIVDISDTSRSLPQPLVAVRNLADRSHATVSIPLAGASQVLKFTDPDSGDAYIAVPDLPPFRGFIKQQKFVDFSLLESAQGVVLHPNADDLQVEFATDKITLGRPGGLTLSAAEAEDGRATAAFKPIFDLASWKSDCEDNFIARRDALTTAAAMATGDRRLPTHVDLARFYLARGFYVEAHAVLDTVLAGAKPETNNLAPAALVIHAVSGILAGNPDGALAELDNPVVGAGYDAQLWKALAYAGQHNWTAAREKFKGVEFAVGALPVELQRIILAYEVRASLETRDYDGVSDHLNELSVLGVPAEMQPSLAVMRGRMDEALGKDKDALSDYRSAMDSDDRPTAAEASVDEISLLQRRNEIAPADALARLETLAVTWRGDTTEIKALQSLAKLYAALGRYRDAFIAARWATKIQPNSESSRQLQDVASGLFADIFLGPKGNDLSPVAALGLFYEFSELTPIGRRGDELIRRLADRLVSVDLLDQASALLQYQVDYRLDGAARAQVASRLAMIYLMNRKPDRAIAALQESRMGDLAGELRAQRLLIEARAQSDIGRHDLALDIIANLTGREVIRLRSDIYWAARRWREASEQIELLYGERWKDFQPLTPEEKGDIIRAGIGYSLAQDSIGIARLREKYSAKMESADDKAAFDASTRPVTADSSEFVMIAKLAASVDTLDGFVREMKLRFPEVASRPLPDEAKVEPPTGSLPAIKGLRPASSRSL